MKLVAKYNNEVIMTGDSKATGIAELSGIDLTLIDCKMLCSTMLEKIIV